MTIQQKDIKILWSRAAGRCSLPDCRAKLVVDASKAVPSQKVLVGKNCHIVAEQPGGPRGNSILAIEDRNSYPNLILLCSNHHDIIDQDPASWPVELLHQVKADHELWVETQLTESTKNRADELYSDIINAATDGLFLSRWEIVSDHAIRDILYKNFVEATNYFCELVFKANWPGERIELENAIKSLAGRVDSYIKHFMTLARLRNDKVWVEDKTWKRVWRNDYHEYAEESKIWQKKGGNLLLNVIVALNEYAEEVRKSINPDYFFLQGKFALYDSLGVTNEMQEIWYIPEKYLEIED
jgi:hypothetical protein